MADKKNSTKYKVVTPILHKGKHYDIGVKITEEQIEKKVIDRLVKTDFLTKVKSFGSIPKDAKPEELKKLIEKTSKELTSNRNKALKVVAELRNKGKVGSANRKNLLSKAEYTEGEEFLNSVHAAYDKAVEGEKKGTDNGENPQ